MPVLRAQLVGLLFHMELVNFMAKKRPQVSLLAISYNIEEHGEMNYFFFKHSRSHILNILEYGETPDT